MNKHTYQLNNNLAHFNEKDTYFSRKIICQYYFVNELFICFSPSLNLYNRSLVMSINISSCYLSYSKDALNMNLVKYIEFNKRIIAILAARA